MHGRVKVKSSEEQEAAKKKEKAEKVRQYREATNRIYDKRVAGEFDDEALKLTRDILMENPEINTFWNYRRQIFKDRFLAMSPEESSSMCADELQLLEYCLKVNPKAYAIWLHREWVVTNSPSPNWTKEKSLCDLFLKYDERNFHCWDYRRFVISKAPDVFTLEEEFDFTYKKIATNFSNYSAWHYRSKLLPKLHPSPEEPGGVAEEALLKEYELVQNAFFTDPDDQSAWFYQRWLLGKVEKPVALACVLLRRLPDQPVGLYVTFNQPVKVTESNPIRVTVGEAPPTVASSTAEWPESLHECSLPGEAFPGEGEVTVKVKVQHSEATVTLREGEREAWWLLEVDQTFDCPLTAATTTVLQSELTSCKELLGLEPDNKWCILTTALLMQALNPRENFAEISAYLGKLCTVDPYRAAYYRDLRSKFVMEQILRERVKQVSSSDRTCNLADKNLSQLFFAEHLLLFKALELSHNQLHCLGPSVRHLVCVEELNLDDNQLEQLPPEMGQLKMLRVLSLRNNKISAISSLDSLRDSQCLSTLHLSGNPVCQLLPSQGSTLLEAVKSILPRVENVD